MNLIFRFLFIFLLMISTWSCTKMEESFTKVKAPLRNYSITSRLDNKQAGTDSKAVGVLKGSYSESTKLLTFSLTFEGIVPASISSIRIDKGAKGSLGIGVVEFPKGTNSIYKSPITGERNLTSLEERDMLKGLWFISIESAKFRPYEIRGLVTIKQL